MKRKIFITILVLLSFALYADDNVRYEYLTFKLTDTYSYSPSFGKISTYKDDNSFLIGLLGSYAIEKELDILAEDGWELVTIYNNNGAYAVLKRQYDKEQYAIMETELTDNINNALYCNPIIWIDMDTQQSSELFSPSRENEIKTYFSSLGFDNNSISVIKQDNAVDIVISYRNPNQFRKGPYMYSSNDIREYLTTMEPLVLNMPIEENESINGILAVNLSYIEDSPEYVGYLNFKYSADTETWETKIEV